MDLVVAESDQIDAATRLSLRALWGRAFGDCLDDNDAHHAYGGGLMILGTDPTIAPAPDVTVTCEDRPGDAW